MKYRLDIQRRALEELSEVLLYYKSLSPQTAGNFELAVESAFDLLLDIPYGSQILKGTIRRLNLKDFPYTLLYAVEIRDPKAADVVVISCIHQRSNPENWPQRPE